MAVQDRFNKEGSIYTLAAQLNDAGDLVDAETEAVTNYRYMVHPQNARSAQLIQDMFGLQPDSIHLLGTGDYNTTIAADQILDDADGNRYRIIAVNVQRGLGIGSEHHVAMVLVDQVRTAAEV